MTAPSLIARLRELLEKATPGPYRAHDHEGMRSVGEDPAKWIGYAWVGRLTKDSTPDGRWDAGWADMDRRKDACKEYRERASIDAHLVAESLNALPDLLTALEAAEAERDHWLREVQRVLPAAQDAAYENTALRERVKRLEGALDPNQTKGAYIGELKDRVSYLDEFGDEQFINHTISWTAMKEFMALIRKQAGEPDHEA